MKLLRQRKNDLLQTYNPPSYEEPMDAVRDYERVKRYTARHPQQGSYAVSTAVDLPRERIRSWVDGDGMPDCYRGLQTAYENGWIIEDWRDEKAKALNCLAAWVLSSGGIDDNWVPTFITDSDDREIEALRRYSRSAGVRLTRTRESDSPRPPEWRPTNAASVLGRVLYTWLRVKGDKTPESVSFPTYLDEAPRSITLAFLRIYVQQRGVRREDRDGQIQIAVNRSDGFRRELKWILQSVVGDPADIRGEAWPLRIRGEAVEMLRRYPEISTSE